MRAQLSPSVISIDMKSHHLFRYPSEWDPRQNGKTKGGYLEGKIVLPKSSGNLRVKISTHPEIPHNFENVSKQDNEIHPTLIHVVRKGKGNRRFNEKEPVPNINHWQQEFEIIDRKVYICNKTSEKDKLRFKSDTDGIPDRDEMFELDDDNVLRIGKDACELNLIILIPKTEKRANSEDVSLNKLLEARTQDDLVFNTLSEMYRGKNSFNLKKVKLKVEVSCLETGVSLGSALSGAISDTASKTHGAMDLHDATPLRSCALGGRKVIMIAEFGLAKDVAPRFQLFDNQDKRLYEEEDKLLNQPTTFSVLKESIIFITPEQPNVETLVMRNYKVKLVARRTSDGYVSRKKFSFDFVPHDYYQMGCIFCTMDPDHRTGPGQVSGPATLARIRDVARPGVRKRQMSGPDVYDNHHVKIKKSSSLDSDETTFKVPLSSTNHDSTKISVINATSSNFLQNFSTLNKKVSHPLTISTKQIISNNTEIQDDGVILDLRNNIKATIKTEPDDEKDHNINSVPFHDLSKSIIRTFNPSTNESLIMPVSVIKSE